MERSLLTRQLLMQKVILCIEERIMVMLLKVTLKLITCMLSLQCYLLLQYNAHINVEWCNWSRSMVKMLPSNMLFVSQKITHLSFWHGWMQKKFILKVKVFCMLNFCFNLFRSKKKINGVLEKKEQQLEDFTLFL